jgi:glycerol-3-phosphate acyltransferase PlsX
VREHDVDVILVGDEPRLRALIDDRVRASPELRARKELRERIERLVIRHAPEVITMHDAPAIAVRHKKQSSMRICFDLVRAKEADALVSAGNSGAMLACGLFVLGRLSGVDRPAIVTTFPTKTGQCALLDMGANVDPKPTVLAQFAVMGSVYARLRHRKPRPRVGLLSNGSEEHKGTALTRDAHALLERSKHAATPGAEFDYVGYVEGRDIFDGDVDVVVTDGFTGNVLLKSCEGAVGAVFSMVRAEVEASGALVKLGAALMRPALRRLWKRTDPAETGGAPLVGVDGVAMICHGGSDARAIKNAVSVAREFANSSLGDELSRAVARHEFLWTHVEATASGGGGDPGRLPS